MLRVFFFVAVEAFEVVFVVVVMTVCLIPQLRYMKIYISGYWPCSHHYIRSYYYYYKLQILTTNGSTTSKNKSIKVNKYEDKELSQCLQCKEEKTKLACDCMYVI